jgi:HEAT repeat protein
VPIRKSSAAFIEALAADLTSESAVTREAAIARLTVIGPRAVDSLVAIVGRPENGPTARLSALRALEALGDARGLDAALSATLDVDAGVASGAVAVARVFLTGRRGPAVLDRLTAVALDLTRPESVRLAAITAVGDLKPSTVKPLWNTLAKDPSPAIRRIVDSGPRRPAADISTADELNAAAQSGLPNDPESLRRLLATAGTDTPLATIHRIVERLREREASVSLAARSDWTRARGAAHVALAKRSSRLALYDLREALEATKAPLPVEFLTALSMAGDVSCLEAIAAACERTTDAWWRQHLVDAFRAIVAREGVTRRHAVLKKIEKRWGRLPPA